MLAKQTKQSREIRLTNPQTQVWDGESRFKVLVCGRRFGKTFLALTWLIRNAATVKGMHWYVAPSYVMSKSIAWRMLKDLADGYYVNKNESELYVEFPSGGILQLKGAENRDSLRGISLKSCVLDEFAYMTQETWTEVIRPATSDQLAPVLFITSPAGWNWAKELYDYAQAEQDDNWQAWSFTTAEGGNVSEDEINAARRELPDRVFRQEYLASFEALANRVYSSFDRSIHVTKDLATIADSKELLIGLDFNVDPMSAVVGVKVADQLHLVDEILLPNSHTLEMAQEIKRRYPKHGIRVYPDPSGKARKTSASGKTDFSILEQAGFRVIAPRAAPSISDRINEVQRMLKDSEGNHRMFVHPRCVQLIKGFEGQVYVNGQPDKSAGLDHILDGLGYLVHSTFPIRKTVAFTGIGPKGF